MEHYVPNFDNKIYANNTGKQFIQKGVDNKKSMMNFTVGVVFNQMLAMQGIKKHGEKAVAAMFKEFKQLDVGAMDGKPVIEPIDPKTLTTIEKEQALEAVNLIKEKRNGDLKGRACGNGAR